MAKTSPKKNISTSKKARPEKVAVNMKMKPDQAEVKNTKKSAVKKSKAETAVSKKNRAKKSKEVGVVVRTKTKKTAVKKKTASRPKVKIKKVETVEVIQTEKETAKITRPPKLKKKRTQPYLSVVVPTYNESKRVPMTLVDIDRRLKEMDLPSYEIVVVDDGSKDNTVEILEKFKELITGLRVIANEENHGKGAVVRQGMLAARGEIRLFMDADNSTTVDQFAKMQPYFEDGVPVVICSRAIRGAELSPPQPWYKGLFGKAGNLFIQALVLPGIWDTQCGFKAFTQAAAEDIFSRQQIERWAFDIEILALAKKLGYKIQEVPAHWVNDLRSHVKAADYLQVLWKTVLIAWRLRRGLPEKSPEYEGE